MSDLISRQAAIDALWKALYAYEDKTEKQFIESDELDINHWFQHRIFVQNMSDIDRQTIQNLPTIEAEPFNCSLEEFGECSYRRTGCSDCEVKEKVRNVIDKAEHITCHDCSNYEEAKNGCNGFCKEWNTSTYSWEWCSRRAEKEKEE